ncbi:unnamed protein product [Moneuplotes crassus]|uniref:Uncharacterized protein n=1 Tax=Euplotes crassus TaxID=5936 RepID=A0AAD1UIU8_EUPCR|nr:unnamed protein product [Moneuplotes crassus]
MEANSFKQRFYSRTPSLRIKNKFSEESKDGFGYYTKEKERNDFILMRDDCDVQDTEICMNIDFIPLAPNNFENEGNACESPNFGSTKVETYSRPSIPNKNLFTFSAKKPFFPRQSLGDEIYEKKSSESNHRKIQHSRNHPLIKHSKTQKPRKYRKKPKKKLRQCKLIFENNGDYYSINIQRCRV